MQNWLFAMHAEDPDPINSGNMKSWFEFYKIDAGVTHVPVNEEIAPGDKLWFLMDGVPIAGASVIKCTYNVGTNKYDAYYDSDNMRQGEDMLSVAVQGVN